MIFFKSSAESFVPCTCTILFADPDFWKISLRNTIALPVTLIRTT